MVTTRELTPGEKLLIGRRREQMSQKEAAEAWSVPLHIYRSWEKDKVEGIPKESIGRIGKNEVCFILRKRASMSVGELSEELGCCRWWLTQMEAGEVDYGRLLSYWKIA